MENKNEVKEVKEVQKTIVPPNFSSKATEEEFFSVLKIVAPGTAFRAALDAALKTEKGALIAVENEALFPIIDGGFRVNCGFTPQRLVELSKMDGAIVLSGDMKRINLVNVLLTPDSKIKTSETGTRHKAAERTAKQIGGLVIAISERKHEITLFYKNIKYQLKETSELLRKANEHIQLIEKQRELFDMRVEELNKLELRNYRSLNQAMRVIQKGRIIQKIANDLNKQIVELGKEGTILKTRFKEIISGVERETNLVIKDYTKLDLKKSKALLDSLSYEEILDHANILRVLAYEDTSMENSIKGWRILSKTSLEDSEIARLVREMGSLGKTIHSNANSYSRILGEEKAQLFKAEIERIKLWPS